MLQIDPPSSYPSGEVPARGWFWEILANFPEWIPVVLLVLSILGVSVAYLVFAVAVFDELSDQDN